MEAKTGATGRISYEEFEPFCKWQREEDRDTLIIHLPDFRKEQLKVHINNRGILKVSGERKVDAARRSKFYKEVVVPRNCNTNAIQAKFANSHLYIIMPKNVNGPAIPDQNIINSPDQTSKQEATQGQAKTPQELGKERDKMVPSGNLNGDQTSKESNGNVAVSRGKHLARIALNVGMLVTVLAALIAFVVYMHNSTLLED